MTGPDASTTTVPPLLPGAVRSPWRFLWLLVRNQPVRYTTSLLVWMTIWTVPLVLGLIAQQYFDGLGTSDAGWPPRTVVLALAGYTLGYVALIFTGMRLHANLMVRSRAGIQRAMLAWILGLPGARPVAETPGEVVSRFRDDTEFVQDAFDFSVDFIGASLSSGVALALLAAVEPTLTIAVFVPVALTVVVVWMLGARIRRYRQDARETTEAVTGFLGESFGAVQSIKVAGAEASLLDRFAALNDRRRAMMVRDRTLTAATDALVNNTANVATGVMLLLAVGTITAGGGQGLTVGEIALFTILLGRMTFGAYLTGQFLARVRQAGVSIERMVALLPGATDRDLVEHHHLEDPWPWPDAPQLPRTDDAPLLEARGVTVRHPGTTVGVEDVDLTVRRGQLVVVTGQIGAGKTTLVRAVLGLLPLDDGELRWEGTVVDQPARTMVPPRVAYTPQVPRLFSMDLRDNLAMGMDVDDRTLQAALVSATMDEDLHAMPEGLDTMVGPRGLRLSGGQIQRTAAARMLVRRPDLLVFDDVSSALDVETEARLWDQLFADADTTALVVSHRRPALARADVVVVLEAGRVAAVGRADELLETSATFRDLWG